MSALHVARQFVLPSKAVLSTEWAADDTAWEPFRVLAMNGRVVSFHVVFALGADLTAVIFAGVGQLPVQVTSLLAEMTFLMRPHEIQLKIKEIQLPRYGFPPSTASDTAG